MEPKVFKLLAPLKDDKGNELNELKARLLTIQEAWQAEDEIKDEDLRMDHFVRLVSGLSEAELEKLPYPDFTALATFIADQLHKPASSWEGNASTKDKHVMLMPFNHGGEYIAETRVQHPSVKAVRLRNKQKDQRDRSLFIISHCTGISVDALKLFSVPDWTELNVRVGDFLQQPTSYFQKTTSN